MALTLQNDQGSVADANAYIDEAFLVAYHADRGLDLSANSTTDLEAAIVRATDYLDQRFTFVGEPIYGDYTTLWPRVNAYDIHNDLVSGIPIQIKRACAEYAVIALSAELNPTPDRDSTGAAIAAKTETVGPLTESVRFAKASSFELPKYPKADRMLIVRGLVVRNRQIRRG